MDVEQVTNGRAAPRDPHADGLSVFWLLRVLLTARRSLLTFCIGGLVIGIIVVLVRRPQYTSSFAFLPQSGQDPSKAAGLASLAGQFGISLGALSGGAQPPQLYADLLTTREVLLPIALDSFPVESGAAERMSLPRFLRVREKTQPRILDKTLRVLRRDVISSLVAARTTGMVTVNVRTESAEVSLRIARQLLEGLNRFNLETRRSQAGEERRFTGARFDSARVALREAENQLQAFLQQNRQYSNSPQLTFERDRLQSDVSLRQQVYQSLAQQYEDARIKEVRDTPVITVIEKPQLPARPDAQLRAWILGISVIAGGLLGVLFEMFRASRAARDASERDPELAAFRAEWSRVRRRGA